MSSEPRPRRPGPILAAPVPPPPEAPLPPVRTRERRPFLLDFFPLESSDQTRLSRFFDRLKEGRVSTTRCPKDGLLHWPPRTACPQCHSEELEWVDLPEVGHVYAFSAVLGGAPLGMEDEVPFAVGLVDLDGAPLRLFGRIEGRPWTELQIGSAVRLESFDIGDGRYFYRFRATDP
ncbi:MAG: Zn-ribbon domain-containing OB-fold protein [Thermoplasmata archaeon]|nr:Zn-ribbon domain-containing OB-fold protein [Thermoplasmata archaeon]